VTAERLEKLSAQVRESVDPEFLSSPANRANASLPGLWIGQELAYELGVLPGDPVSLVSPIETEGPFSAVPRMKRFLVHGIYHSGTPEQELQNVYASMGSVRSFLRRSSGVSQWEISVSNFDRAERVGDHLKKAPPELQEKDWTELNGQLFASLKLERFAMFVSLTFIIIVASFNIVTTLTLMVLQKRREISILKAMGARPGQIGAIFLAEGMYIGGVGVGGGVVLAWVLCMLLKRYEFIQLPDIYYDRTLPVTFDWAYYLGVPVVAMAIVLVACLYPSRRASRLNAIDGIRLG
jgi:lipoprotein-releasing system permease protein